MLLTSRSIFLQTCLLLIISLSECQNYESEYAVEDDGEHEDIQEESSLPDYSKYYSVDTSAPLLSAAAGESPESTGFVTPFQFGSFFGPSLEFGASNKEETIKIKDPFAKEDKKTLGFINIKEEFPLFHSSASHMKDYFEESQKKQQQENQEEASDNSYDSKPGPSYISHQVPAKYAEVGSYSSQVEQIKPKKKSKSKDYNDASEQSASELDNYKAPDYSYDYSSPAPGKYADYNTGKSSSTVSQYPQAAGHKEKILSAPTPTPYQKYSFQPVTEFALQSKYLGSLISTAAPYNPAYNKIAGTENTPSLEFQSSENIPKHLRGKGCKRVKKHIKNTDSESGKTKRDAMNCYVCEDPKTSSKYTQCSYEAEPSATNQESTNVDSYYPTAKDPESYRQKRYSGEDFSVDPYEYIKSRSQSAYPKQDEAESYNEEYAYTPDDYYSVHDKSSSEVQSEKIAKNPANCVKEVKDGMTCTICKDASGGGNFEQCSYTSDPKEEKYAYVTEKKYDSNDEPAGTAPKPVVESKTTYSSSPKDSKSKKESSERKNDSPYSKESIKKLVDDNPYESSYHYAESKPKKESVEKKNDSPYSKESIKKLVDDNPYESSYHYAESKPKKESIEKTNGSPYSKKSVKSLVDDNPYEIPHHFAESTAKEQKAGVRGLEPSLYGGVDSAESTESANTKSPYGDIHDEYHFKLFPEYTNEESKQSETEEIPESSKKDVAEVLLEFSKKDRSACKKAEKNGMTCYLCLDKKGIQHEECMYVSESKPQATHVAYHELQQIKSPEKKTVDQLQLLPDTAESQHVPEAAKSEYQKMFKKATTPLPFLLEQAASEEKETRIKYKPKPKKNRRKNSKKGKKSKAKEPKTAASEVDSEKLKDGDEPPIKFAIDDEEGLYSAETQPVYSKALGVKLPRYMIEKSEFEKEFDEFAGEH